MSMRISRHNFPEFSCLLIAVCCSCILYFACSKCVARPNLAAQKAAKRAVPRLQSHFDGANAFMLLEEQCAFGPRVPNTREHEKACQQIIKELRPFVDKFEQQPFNFYDPDRHIALKLMNIIGEINPKAKRKILLFTHWDTRPTADQEPDKNNRLKPIIGADDAASGTAILLELARTLHRQKPDVGVILLFVDGEDWGPHDNHMYLGAKYYSEHLPKPNPEYGILLDMVGDKNLQIFREQTSQRLHPEINDKIWTAANALGYGANFPNAVKWGISDDHDALNAAGIPSVDVIDFDYPFWHTLKDTPDKCSAKSLQTVGDVLLKVLSQEKR